MKSGAGLNGKEENGICIFMGPVKIKLLNYLTEFSAMKKITSFLCFERQKDGYSFML